MIVMIERLRKVRGAEDTFISWDSRHGICRALDERVKFLNGWANYDRAPIMRTRTIAIESSVLNVIESIFSGMSRAVVHNSDFADLDAAKAMIDKYFAHRNAYYIRSPSRAGNKIWGKERHPAVFRESHNYKDPRYR
jgi:hypothetical protein